MSNYIAAAVPHHIDRAAVASAQQVLRARQRPPSLAACLQVWTAGLFCRDKVRCSNLHDRIVRVAVSLGMLCGFDSYACFLFGFSVGGAAPRMFSSTGSGAAAAVAAASASAEQTARLQREIKTQENWDRAMEPQLQEQKAAVLEEMKLPDFGMHPFLF